jgi:Fis family transcriptional regulator
MSFTTTTDTTKTGSLSLGAAQLSLTEVSRDTFKQYYEGRSPATTTDVYGLMLAKIEPAILKQTLKFTRENQSQSAIVLGLSRGTCRKLLKQYGMLERGTSVEMDVENIPGEMNSALSQSINETITAYYAQVDVEQTTGVYEMVLAEVEEPLLLATLEFTKDNQSRAAIVLGLSRGTLRKLMKKYGVN